MQCGTRSYSLLQEAHNYLQQNLTVVSFLPPGKGAIHNHRWKRLACFV